MPTSTPCILHLDADAFFASVEQRDEPRLRGKPVAVGTGVVASCSYESRRWGVRTAMRLADAKRLCPPLIVLPGDYRRYEQAARRILAVCLEYTPRVEAVALDDLYLDLTQSGGVDVERLAVELRTQIAHEIELSVSMGVAANKLVASVATDHAKKIKCGQGDGSGQGDKGTRGQGERFLSLSPCPLVPLSPCPYSRSSLVRVPAGEESAYLAPWPVEVLPGVGPKTFERLQRLNVRRVGELAAMPTAVLCGLFGSRGTAPCDLAHGVDQRMVQPYRPQQSVSRCTSFEPATSDRAFLLGMLDHLLDRAAAWLRFSGVAARGLKVSLRYGDYTSDESRVALRPPSNDDTHLKAAGRERLLRLYQRRLPLRYLGVELAPLVVPQHQPELFPDPLVERDRRLAECKDAVRRRFGFMALVSGTALVVSQQVEQDRDNFHLRTPCLTK